MLFHLLGGDDIFPLAGFSDIGMSHLGRIYHAVELSFANEPEFEGSLFQREIVVQGVVRNLRSLVVSNDRR